MASKFKSHRILSKKRREEQDPINATAATMIQRIWRARRNKAREELMSPGIRWEDATQQAELQVAREAAFAGENSPMQRWRRVITLIGRLRYQNQMLEGVGTKVEGAEVKQLEAQHWLELIDEKHRYGSNLKYYHKRWVEEDTRDNFFRWLDAGGGKNLSLNECPRERLEREKIIYLSVEQRLNYLVKISEDGKLLWIKNDQPVDTTPGQWKDAGDGRGIVPMNMPERSLRVRRPWWLGSSLSASSSQSATEDSEATHYVGNVPGRFRWTRALKGIFTPRGFTERLLRKTVRKNTWVYVSDKHFNIYIGIKETGAFQHSSFTAGGIVTSAGLITVKQGLIHTLSPLSGHYRTSVDHFHQFVDVLEERGVDIGKVKISKAELALWGVEHLAKIKKKQSKAMEAGKKKVKLSGSKTNWRREISEGKRPRTS